MNSPILLFSGGLDSTLTYYYLMENNEDFKKNPRLLFYYIGHRYCESELHNLKRMFTIIPSLSNVEIIYDYNFTWLGKKEKENAHIPLRNMLLIQHAWLNYSKIVYLGGLSDDRVGDNSEEFFKQLSDMCSGIDMEEYVVSSPIRHFEKTDLVKWFYKSCKLINEEEKLDIIMSTFSCYSEKHSGLINSCCACKACFRKNVVLFSNLDLFIPFKDENIIEQYKTEIENGKLTGNRGESTLLYINEYYKLKNDLKYRLEKGL